MASKWHGGASLPGGQVASEFTESVNSQICSLLHGVVTLTISLQACMPVNTQTPGPEVTRPVRIPGVASSLPQRAVLWGNQLPLEMNMSLQIQNGTVGTGHITSCEEGCDG